MPDPGTNAVAAAQDAALDFASLREQGVALLQRLAGQTWTDHNTHDPGITILEQLCYALTDLGYRAQYELPDLLTREGDDPYASLYTPAQVLPTSPVTITDLRKLVIDVPGVKNAWIDIVDEPAATFDAAQAEVSHLAQATGQGAPAPSPNVSEIRVKGLFRVQLEKMGSSKLGGIAIGQEAARRLHRFRGLGEDFQEIKVLDDRPVQLGATLEIDAVRDVAALLANVYQGIAAYMSPSVPFHTLGEMLERGRRVDEIFEGPLLEHGFIDSEELASIERRTSLRISDLIHALVAVPGVVAVKNLHFLSEGQPSKEWLLEIEAGKTPQFDWRKSDIRLEKRGLRVDQGIRGAAHDLFQKREREAARPAQTAAQDRDLRPRPGRDRKIANYHSVQHEFPMVYGIGAAGLSESASPERKSQAKQLKAYLMFYDQLLANQFAQLANVGRLFSFHDETPDSYFSQAVQDDGPLGLKEIRVSSPDPDLRQITEAPSKGDPGDNPGVRRRNRFLDHLLARFGEQFRDYALLQPGANTRGGITAGERLARDKRAFLRDYPRIGRDRGAAFDCLEPPGEGNASGLEQALRRKLGASDPEERFYLVEHILLRPIAGDMNQQNPLFRAARVRDPYSLQISFVFPGGMGRYVDLDFRQFVEQTVQEETPAHLTAYVLWKNPGEMQAFESAYAAWLSQLRNFRMAALGI